MLDIDHFKRFNDTYGHAACDEVLHDLGVLLRGSLRASDIACRYAGEELIKLLAEATHSVAAERAAAIRASARRLSVRDGARPAEPISLSIGVAAFLLDGAAGAAQNQQSQNCEDYPWVCFTHTRANRATKNCNCRPNCVRQRHPMML